MAMLGGFRPFCGGLYCRDTRHFSKFTPENLTSMWLMLV